jgi:hypothetical protein
MSVRGLDMNNEQVAELLYPALETEKGGIQVDAYQRDFELAVRTDFTAAGARQHRQALTLMKRFFLRTPERRLTQRSTERGTPEGGRSASTIPTLLLRGSTPGPR